MKIIEKINWGTVLVDIVIILSAAFSGHLILIFLLFFTNGYTLKEKL